MQAVDLFELYVSWLRNNAPMAYDNLSPPATATELDILEEALGQALPNEVKDVLKRHNGQLSVITPAGDHGVPCIPTLNFCRQNISKKLGPTGQPTGTIQRISSGSTSLEASSQERRAS